MAIGREIKHKIKSTQNMRKVTRALEMVSASKIRKAQELMQASRPYARMMRQVIAHLAHATPEYHHPFLMEAKEIRNVGFIVVSTDRGQCGGLNSNLFRKVLPEISRWRDQGVGVDVVAIGQKSLQLFRRTKGVNLAGSVTKLGDRPRVEKLVGVIKVMLDAYRHGELQRVFLVYNDFVNSMTQKPRVDALLPLPVVARELETPAAGESDSVVPQDIKRDNNWDYLYEPEPAVVLKYVLTRYVESLVYQATLENLASEHAARRVAMKNASDNANKVIDTLMLSYNKARQASITQEISEIVSGAAAV